jgi:RNA-directed DNA polymerase
VRYADDFVILCTDLAGIQAAQAATAVWLAGRGLQLSPTKTHLTHTLTPYEGRVGFDFLGCTIRQFPAGKTRSGKRSNGTLLGFRTHITPSKQAVSRHLAATRASIRQHRTVPQAALIADLNPRIRGWAAYYRSVAASRVYALCEHRLFAQLWHWARRRHPRAARHDVARRYWLLQPGARWVFAVREAGAITLRLQPHATRVRRHVKVRGTASPYDGNLVYWTRRLREHPLTSTTLGRLLAAQQGKCARCGLLFRDTDLLEIDHVVPTSQGGSDHFTNQQVLHRHCHDQTTVADRHGRVSLPTTT